MDDEREICGFRELRLFPLGGVVFFPHSVLPLHIFEPRYRQMTEDALADDRLVTIVMIRPGGQTDAAGAPELEEYGCVGRIFKHQRLPDGRFNMLLVGLKRVRLLHELDGDRQYRVAKAEILDDIGEATDPERSDLLLQNLRSYLEPAGGVDADLEKIISSDLPLGVLVDILSHSLNMPVADKQMLLAEPLISSRADRLLDWLRAEIRKQREGTSSSRNFPPRFSQN
jgi:Lon protease-like protein